jgi:hypothetical protein
LSSYRESSSGIKPCPLRMSHRWGSEFSSVHFIKFPINLLSFHSDKLFLRFPKPMNISLEEMWCKIFQLNWNRRAIFLSDFPRLQEKKSSNSVGRCWDCWFSKVLELTQCHLTAGNEFTIPTTHHATVAIHHPSLFDCIQYWIETIGTIWIVCLKTASQQWTEQGCSYSLHPIESVCSIYSPSMLAIATADLYPRTSPINDRVLIGGGKDVIFTWDWVCRNVCFCLNISWN